MQLHWQNLDADTGHICIAKGEELDQRIRCLPPAYGTRHFKNGISALSQVSGSKRKDMAHILLGCLVGRIPHALMLTLRALLDFIYIVQYSTHDGQTLKYLEDALVQYHKHKDILKTLSLVHYANSIRSLGTTDNYNTEMFKRLHIDCAKKAWRASNHRNERPQMTKWLEQREKIAMFESLCYKLGGIERAAQLEFSLSRMLSYMAIFSCRSSQRTI
ncbi:hypothetical protein C8Q72DRAFT_890516 [Fomitopsis betulina]|nr:hypothetical protein C8Q72DRAFT_890516 [Fomitopsis betulina]